MKYYEANNLLAQVREEYPTLFSGTVYNTDLQTWMVHIGPNTHMNQIASPMDWAVFCAENLPQGAEIPKEWLHTPKPEAERKGSPVPFYTVWMSKGMSRLPKPVSTRIWKYLLVPPLNGLKNSIQTLARWGVPEPIVDWLIGASWYVPLFPVFIEAAIRAEQIAISLAPVIARQMRDEGGDLSRIVPLPGGGHVHIVQIDATDKTKAEVEAMIRQHSQEIQDDHFGPRAEK